MKIPEKINIAGREIKIEWAGKELNKRNSDGETDYRANKIILVDNKKIYGQCQEDIDIVFIHEIIHFINHVTTGNMDEETIGRFAEILYQVIKQLIWQR